MNRNTAVGSLIAVFVCAFVWGLWHLSRSGQRAIDIDGGTNVPASGSTPAGSTPPLPPALDSREKREELRRKILAAWMKGEQGDEAAKDAKEGRFEPHPNKNGEGIDPAFIQSAMREQMWPMVKDCYEDLLSRQPDAGGKLDLWFKIVADDKLGGLVEEDDEHDGGIVGGSFTDEKLQTCVRESLMTVTFPPPAHGGVVTVGYPIVMTQEPEDEKEK